MVSLILNCILVCIYAVGFYEDKSLVYVSSSVLGWKYNKKGLTFVFTQLLSSLLLYVADIMCGMLHFCIVSWSFSGSDYIYTKL